MPRHRVILISIWMLLTSTSIGCSADQVPIATAGTPARHLILATTTSTDDSGLLAYLLPDFEAEHDIQVDVVAVGTGQALQLGVDGTNADAGPSRPGTENLALVEDTAATVYPTKPSGATRLGEIGLC